MADTRITLVSNPSSADLIFVDESALDYSVRNSVDMKFCKRSYMADKRIRVGPTVLMADYRLYFDSEEFTLEEAAGLFPAIWKFNEN